jgi:rubrerythrin
MKGMQFLTPVASMDAGEIRSVLHDIAEEEKDHLAVLGSPMQART